jgi:Amt family ammonium transporter
MIMAFLVFLIIPGIGFLYSGLARRKSALSMLFQSFAVMGVVTFQWMFWGYSLAYSRSASPFIGNMDNFGLKNVMSAPSPGSSFLPEIVFNKFYVFPAFSSSLKVIYICAELINNTVSGQCVDSAAD